jgi:hypothetical protein
MAPSVRVPSIEGQGAFADAPFSSQHHVLSLAVSRLIQSGNDLLNFIHPPSKELWVNGLVRGKWVNLNWHI